MSSSAASSFRTEEFGQLPDGSPVKLHWLEAEGGLRVALTDYGAAIHSLWAPDSRGALADVTLGYDTLEGFRSGRSYFGAIIGRYGNRIAGGRFSLDGREHVLATNDGDNHLHGGMVGLDKTVWESAALTLWDGSPAVKFWRVSPDGEEGYPGELKVEVTYLLPTPDTLAIQYHAETSAPTPVNLTNHCYFNLAGHDAEQITGHEVQIFAEHFLPVNEGLIPTGEYSLVEGTPFDLRQPRAISAGLASDHTQIRLGLGYDHTFVLCAAKTRDLHLAARVLEPGSGRIMEVLTTEPGIQFYSGNFLSGAEIGKGGKAYHHRTGFCLETQHFPDSPNQPAFPSVILRPGETYESSTVYRFTAR